MASYGIETEKEELSFVCRKPLNVLKAEADGKPIKFYDIQLEKAEKENEKMIVNHLIEDGNLNKQEEEYL